MPPPPPLRATAKVASRKKGGLAALGESGGRPGWWRCAESRSSKTDTKKGTKANRSHPAFDSCAFAAPHISPHPPETIKAFSVLGWAVSLQFVLSYGTGVAAAAGVDAPVQNKARGVAAATKMRMMKGCKGRNNMKCSAPRRQPRPTRRPTVAPAAGGDACLTYTKDSTGLTNHLYGVARSDPGLNWPEARAAVAGMKSCCGGTRPRLVTIASEAENDLVLSLFESFDIDVFETAYIGLTNRNQSSDATFEWDGPAGPEPLQYQNWDRSDPYYPQPDNGPNACAAMILDYPLVSPGLWYDYYCDISTPPYYVFEYDCP
jgi:Lectin C-type domain